MLQNKNNKSLFLLILNLHLFCLIFSFLQYAQQFQNLNYNFISFVLYFIFLIFINKKTKLSNLSQK